MAYTKAVRHKVKLKIALIGSSGSGKTYSALRVARGIAGETGRIALLDTENDRGLYYADEFEYDHDTLTAPYTPERYIQKIDEAVRADYDVLIIDSISHEWSGVGGCLEMVDKLQGKNNYTKWGQITPRHNAFIEKVIQSPIHIIVTIRGKDQYVLEQDDRGKQVPKKVGLGGIQRDGIEYEYTLTFLIDRDTHIATAQKDNTHIFDSRFEMLTEDHGVLFREWADGGIVAPKELDRPETRNHAGVTDQSLQDINELLGVENGEVKKRRSMIANGFLKKVKVERLRNLSDEQAQNLIKLLIAVPNIEEPVKKAI